MSLFDPPRGGNVDENAIDNLARRLAAELKRQVNRSHARQAASLYRERRLRERHFPGRLFFEPAWDLLLDLFIAGQEGRDVSVTSACLAAGVPTTTALRYLQWLTDQHLIERVPHTSDGRSTLVRISEAGNRSMIAYLDDLEAR